MWANLRAATLVWALGMARRAADRVECIMVGKRVVLLGESLLADKVQTRARGEKRDASERNELAEVAAVFRKVPLCPRSLSLSPTHSNVVMVSTIYN